MLRWGRWYQPLEYSLLCLFSDLCLQGPFSSDPCSEAHCSPPPSGGLSWYPQVESPFLLCTPGVMSHVAPTTLICSFRICLSLKDSFSLGGRGGRSKTGTSPGPSTVWGAQWASHKHSPKQQAALKRSECSPLAKLPTWAAACVCRTCFWWPPPGTREKFWPFLPLMLGLVHNLFPLPASSLLFLVSPMTPVC